MAPKLEEKRKLKNKKSMPAEWIALQKSLADKPHSHLITETMKGDDDHQFKFYNYTPGDGPDTILKNNYMLRALLGMVPLTSSDDTGSEDITEVVKDAGQRLANMADMDYILKKMYDEKVQDKRKAKEDEENFAKPSTSTGRHSNDAK